MNDITSGAFRVLKVLNKVENSRYFTPEQTYWLSYLHKRGLVAHTFIETSPRQNLGVYIISKSGQSALVDHKNKTLKTFIFWLVPVLLTVTGLLIAIL